MLSRDGAPVASRLTSVPPTQLGSGNDSGAGERRGMRVRPGDVVAIKPPIKRNGFAVALRRLRSATANPFRLIGGFIATTSPGRTRMPRRSPAPESFPLPSCVGGTLVRRLATGAPSRDNIAEQIQRWRSDLGLTDESV